MPSHVFIPIEQTPPLEPGDLLVRPRRTAMIDPSITVGGVAENCNACHQIFESDPTTTATTDYHTDIQLSHGMNNRCANCHDTSDHERLVLRDGSAIEFIHSPQLCAQCHGTAFRDWERDTHGKTLGSWIPGSENQQRLSCIECHDPHAPRYEPFVPLPGPRTLRMGDQTPHPHVGGKQSPLQRWLTPTDNHGHDNPHETAHESHEPIQSDYYGGQR